MINISAEQRYGSKSIISPMSIKRDWMDSTPEKHAYRCFPVTQANMIGWSLSWSEDIRFIWNGINNTSQDNVEILTKSDSLYTGRGQSSISFTTGLTFKTEKNISLFTINPVNYFSSEFETMSSLISTSWFDNDFPLAIKAKIPNKEILIKAGEPIATIIPISLTNLDNTSIKIYDYEDQDRSRQNKHKTYGEAAQKINQSGNWTDWYRDAVDEKGNSLGSHETKVLRISVENNRKNGII
jgi:hypothetical protein